MGSRDARTVGNDAGINYDVREEPMMMRSREKKGIHHYPSNKRTGNMTECELEPKKKKNPN